MVAVYWENHTYSIPEGIITALTRVRHLSLSWASPIQSIYPHPTSWRSVLILSTHLRLGLPSGLLPSGFTTKTLYTPLSSPIRATCPAHLVLLNFITRTIFGELGESYEFLYQARIWEGEGCATRLPNRNKKKLIFLNTMISNVLRDLCSCRNHPLQSAGD